MKDQNSGNCRDLAETIAAVSAARVPLPSQAVKYARSIFGDKADIFLLVEEDASSEAACLAELLFFPDESFQTAVEASLLAGALSPEQIRRLKEILEASPPVFCFAAQSGKTPHPLSMPSWAVSGFVDRLRLDRMIPGAVRTAVNRWENAPDRLLAFVKLRNAGKLTDGQSADFLVRLFDGLVPEPPDKWDLLDLALELLGMRPPALDMFPALCFIKGRFLHMLKQQRETERLMAKGAMETLLLQKIPVAALDEAALREKILRLDRISQMVYGLAPRVPAQEQTIEDVMTGDFSGVLEMIRRMAL